ncbi:hypothetical protein DUNSADRAFT_3928 [Dunaliella salina]|uniref:Uncharacterized protein n=1 Tax=Dunaliella salina TaxID=3046 RepID=A0ABQ7H7S3_DUNSA|nr:hypothetical protein DUNSADRAFT_3928 [Dunaliella salina]|eukprot:KAF5842901.1 hypothetical protein DUNSADRAFT_3928 [Dunaliella salina]
MSSKEAQRALASLLRTATMSLYKHPGQVKVYSKHNAAVASKAPQSPKELFFTQLLKATGMRRPRSLTNR